MTFEFKYSKNGGLAIIKREEGEEPEYITYDADGDVLSGQEQEVHNFAQFLRHINEYYGPSTSRYSKARIYVNVEPGDNHDDYYKPSPDDEL